MAVRQLADRVLETSTTTGTGTFTLLGAVTGYRAFSVFADADTVYYVIVAVDASSVPTGQWEVGLGTVGGSGTTIARTTLISSSTGSAINFSAGTKQVFVGLPSSLMANGGAVTMPEITEPSAPAANNGVFYFEDNGAGKTRFCVKFPSGVAQILATEP